jgi:hypothetical protein
MSVHIKTVKLCIYYLNVTDFQVVHTTDSLCCSYATENLYIYNDFFFPNLICSPTRRKIFIELIAYPLK